VRVCLRAEWARLAVRSESWRAEVHLAREPAQRVPREHPLSPTREAIDILYIYSGHLFIGVYTRRTRAIRAEK
jgi:hypothetical protein